MRLPSSAPSGKVLHFEPVVPPPPGRLGNQLSSLASLLSLGAVHGLRPVVTQAQVVPGPGLLAYCPRQLSWSSTLTGLS